MSADQTDAFIAPPRPPHLAEMVADRLRQQILSGELSGGSLLAKQEDLLVEFGVSKPSLREAFRILENEGLLTVKRGKVGGAIVHVPRPESAAYNLALVMQSRDVSVSDVGRALRLLEPQCAALCAERPDRHTAVVPALRAVHEQAGAATEHDELTRLARRFHELFVELCGNETMILVVGALESLWTAHERDWAGSTHSQAAFSTTVARRRSHAAHGKIVTLIEAGNIDGVARLVRGHLEQSVFYSRSTDAPETIRAHALKPTTAMRGPVHP